MFRHRKRLFLVVAGVCFLVGFAMGGLSEGRRQRPEAKSALAPRPELLTIRSPSVELFEPLPHRHFAGFDRLMSQTVPAVSDIPDDGCTIESRTIAEAIAAVSAAHQTPPCDIAEVIVDAAHRYGVDPFLVVAVGQTESSWRLHVRGPKGEWGPMQVMPNTAKAMGAIDLQDWRQTLDAGVRYLADMIKRADGDISLALAFYNAGPSRGGERARVYAGDYPDKVLRVYRELQP